MCYKNSDLPVQIRSYIQFATKSISIYYITFFKKCKYLKNIFEKNPGESHGDTPDFDDERNEKR